MIFIVAAKADGRFEGAFTTRAKAEMYLEELPMPHLYHILYRVLHS